MGKEFESNSGPNREIVVVARLLDRQYCPDSGERHYGLVMKYKLITTLLGCVKSEGDTLYVVHGAPELARFIYYKVSKRWRLLNLSWATKKA